jgi:hypothetical protein
MTMQEQHDLAYDFLLAPAGYNLRGPLGTDAGHPTQFVRLLLDQVEYRLANAPTSFLAYTGPIPRIIPDPR